VSRDLLAREGRAPAWRELAMVFRKLEARGEIRGGRFIAGTTGEQFAQPESVDLLRAVRREKPDGTRVRLSPADPLNLIGIVTPGSRIPGTARGTIVLKDGVPEDVADSGDARTGSRVA
jgi:ATP-dependent Lhr-like helicase